MKRSAAGTPEGPRSAGNPARRLLIAGLLALAFALPAAADARSTIVWTRNFEHRPRAQIVAAQPNGKGLHELTDPKKRNFDIDAQISPDGTDHPCCVGDIWTVRADGTHRKPVSQASAFEYRPDWGPAP